jgi:hypothetical protein
MNGASPLKHGFVDFAAVLFVIGGVVSLVMSILTIPINTIYPLTAPTNLSLVFWVVLGIDLICSLGAIHCYSLTIRRLLSEAGIRGIIFGALLVFFSMGLIGSFRESNTSTLLTAVSAVLILVGGIICFALRHTNVSASSIAHQHIISQPSYRA